MNFNIFIVLVNEPYIYIVLVNEPYIIYKNMYLFCDVIYNLFLKFAKDNILGLLAVLGLGVDLAKEVF